MQKWDYKVIVLVHGVGGKPDRIYEDTVLLEVEPSVFPMAKRLGEVGWELVSMTSMSYAEITGWAGSTTKLTYWFKRPKE